MSDSEGAPSPLAALLYCTGRRSWPGTKRSAANDARSAGVPGCLVPRGPGAVPGSLAEVGPRCRPDGPRSVRPAGCRCVPGSDHPAHFQRAALFGPGCRTAESPRSLSLPRPSGGLKVRGMITSPTPEPVSQRDDRLPVRRARPPGPAGRSRASGVRAGEAQDPARLGRRRPDQDRQPGRDDVGPWGGPRHPGLPRRTRQPADRVSEERGQLRGDHDQ